jgi:hypothetical protein
VLHPSVSKVENSSGTESESSLSVTLEVEQEARMLYLTLRFLHPEFHAAWYASQALSSL